MQAGGTSRTHNVRLDVHEVCHAFPRRTSAGDAAGVFGHVAQGLHGGAQVSGKQHQITQGHGTIQHAKGAADHHGCRGQAHDHIGGAFQPRRQPSGRHAGVKGDAVGVHETLPNVVFQPVGLHHLDGGQGFLRGVGQAAFGFAGAT